MLQQFLHHIRKHSLFTGQDKILLTVSGGIDSMVMLHLFKQAGFSAGVAHCNFQLRGEESDQDEQLVRNVATAYGFPFHTRCFNVLQYVEAQGFSVQMAARALRYAWFDELADQHGYNHIATAHHLNDNIETVLLNLVKGTGMDGLTGIPAKRDKLVRPLLFASRAQVTAYAREQALAWREDSSNRSDYYQRNLIRNQVMPLLRQINPNLEETFAGSHERIIGSRDFASSFLKDFYSRAVQEESDRLLISKALLMAEVHAAVLLWELLKEHGFNYGQCVEITNADHQPGKIFCTDTHQLTVDREYIIITQAQAASGINVSIAADCQAVEAGGMKLVLENRPRHDFELQRTPLVAQLDAEKLKFPLTWRNWQPGDHFVPLGMKHHKKISDFLVDLKVPLPDKQKVTVIESDGQIVWVAGRRIAESFRITDETRRVLIIGIGNTTQKS